MKNIRFGFVFYLACVCVTSALADDTVFARQGDVVLTQDELDAAFARIPEIHRLAFIRDGERVNKLVKSLLQTRQISRDANAHDYEQDPVTALRMQMAAEKELAEAWLDHVVASAPEVNYESLAYEHYLANPEQYQTPEMLDVSHILIKSDTRPELEALELARRLYNDLLADPSLFDEYVMEYSEDPAKSSNAGRYRQMQKGQMVRQFENAAFALSTPGEITDLVQTDYGFHIIRLNRRIDPKPVPFEQIKLQAIEQAKGRYEANYRRNYLLKLNHEPIELPEGAVDAMVKRYFGENLELAPEFPQ